jgi:putative NADPH-quinone reductase
MRAVVVVADPDPGAFTHELAGDARATLLAHGHDVTFIDLCAAGYRASMSPEEKRAYDTDDPIVEPIVADHAQAVGDGEILVVVYPTVTAGPPAVLKAWFERTMVQGVAFVFDERHKLRANLTQMRRMVGISTYAEPRWRVRLRGDVGRRLLGRTLRTSTGLRSRTRWLAMYRGDDGQRAAFRAHVRAVVGRL